MQDDYSCQVLPGESNQIDLNPEDIVTEDEKTYDAATVIEMKLRNVMTDGEVQILTSWFPKAAQTLASVLRNRPH